MPPPRRREAALAPLRGATLAPACLNSAVGTRGCLSHFSQMALTLPKSVFPAAGLCHPSLVWCQPLTTLHCWGHTGMAPKDKQQQGAGSRASRRGPPQEPGNCLSPRTRMLKLWGERRKQQHSSCLPCSSQHALGLKWCQRL